MPPLTDTEREMLKLEAQWFRHSGVKESAVLKRFGMSLTAYYVAVNALLDNPAAEAFDPITVRRLRRVRRQRQASRSARALGLR